MDKYSEEVVGFEGLSKVGDMLKEVPVELRDGILQTAFGKALRTVVKPGLVSATPYDTITAGRRGKVKTISKDKFIIVTNGKRLKGLPPYNPTQMVIGYAGVVYPMRWVEYGTQIRFTESYRNKKLRTPANKNVMDKTPNPFVRAYYQSVISQLQEYVKNELANEIDKIIKKKLKS